MDRQQIDAILNSEPWSSKKLEEAARGKAIGACDDPPEVEFKFWVEMARDEANRNGVPAEPAVAKLVRQALAGVFG